MTISTGATLPKPGAELPTGLDLALYWAERGWPVTPVDPGEKNPIYGKRWELAGSHTNPDQVRQLWAKRPGAWVGIRCGIPKPEAPDQTAGPDVIDFDCKDGKPGLRAMELLTDAGLIDGWSMKVRTRSGGVHLYYLVGSSQGLAKEDWCGVDFRSGPSGLIVAPGNPGYTVEQVV